MYEPGDLVFGEGFGCLQNAAYHPWVGTLLGNLKLITFVQAIRHYPFVEKLARMCIPASIQAKALMHYEFAEIRARRRMKIESNRKDFIYYISKQNDKKGGITEDEIMTNAPVLTMAGSETTATWLSGLTYYLLKSPKALQILTEEIRSAFATEDKINFKSVANLEYLNACLDEGLRMYPAGPIGFPRRVPAGGDTIAGYYVPKGVRSVANIFHLQHELTTTLFSRPASQSAITAPTAPSATSNPRTPSSLNAGSTIPISRPTTGAPFSPS